MMTNLFSSFDPTTSSFLASNWVSIYLFILLVMPSFWLIKNRLLLTWGLVLQTLHNEFKTLLGATSFKGTTLIFVGVFILILNNNFMGLYPYIFTGTSHMAMTLTLSLPVWVALMIMGWLNFSSHMFAHLVPQSTPGPLMPFMVLIETVSNMIRPGTLAVRLAANMIAGHLLMTLLGNQTASVSQSLVIFLLITQVLLLVLESAVAIIQSYVFAVLSTLYTSEITH